MKKILSSLMLAAVALSGTGLAYAQAATSVVAQFQGPGGHSSGNYGRTSALHAAARAMMAIFGRVAPAAFLRQTGRANGAPRVRRRRSSS